MEVFAVLDPAINLYFWPARYDSREGSWEPEPEWLESAEATAYVNLFRSQGQTQVRVERYTPNQNDFE